jgi:hypothetical protein
LARAAAGERAGGACAAGSYFTILNSNEIGHKRPVLTGLALDGDPDAQVRPSLGSAARARDRVVCCQLAPSPFLFSSTCEPHDHRLPTGIT